MNDTDEGFFLPRLVIQEGPLRVVRIDRATMVMEERTTDSLGNPSWRIKMPIPAPPGLPACLPEATIIHDLYLLFSAMEAQ